jgi:DNA-binding MarR family transcriptional regulator
MKTLDVKTFLVKDSPMAQTTDEQDHIDRFLAEHDLPGVDLEVEGIVDRINGLRRRFNTMADETLRQFEIGLGEWRVLNSLRLGGKPYRRSAGQLAKRSELSSGAMTNRLDRLEESGLVKRVRDPDDRRGVLVELTKEGHQAWEKALGAQAANESLIADALTKDEQHQLNALLRRLMREFEQREQDRAKP